MFGLLAAPFAIGEAAAKVGVTSATDGDPLGKPPQEAERVLRIGVDVQANELITTSANDRAHLLFLDGSSLTVGPNAQLTIDKFVFDPTTKTGELAINASKGVLRLVGGKISKNGPIVITTPANTVGIRGGITILDVKANQTDSVFVFGKDMTVRAAGQTQIATRPGSMIVTNLGGPPGLPTILAQGALNAQLAALEGGRRGSQSGSGGGSGGGRNPDQVAQSSGLSGVNSSQSTRIVAPGVPDNFGSGPGPRNRNPNDTIVTALSNTNQSVQTNTATQSQTQTQAQTQPPTDKPSLFDQFLSGQFPLGSFDLAQLNIHPNSVISTVNELSTLNAQRATATYNGPVAGLHQRQSDDWHLSEHLELRQSKRRHQDQHRRHGLQRHHDASRQWTGVRRQPARRSAAQPVVPLTRSASSFRRRAILPASKSASSASPARTTTAVSACSPERSSARRYLRIGPGQCHFSQADVAELQLLVPIADPAPTAGKSTLFVAHHWSYLPRRVRSGLRGQGYPTCS